MGKDWKPGSYPLTVPPEDSDLSKVFTKEELLENLQYMADACIEVHPNLFFSLSSEALDADLLRLAHYRKEIA